MRSPEMTAATRTVRITYVVRGTDDAAMIGLDEVVQTDSTDEEIIENAEYHAACQGYDSDMYEVCVEVVTAD
jgi:hypothetical protein